MPWNQWVALVQGLLLAVNVGIIFVLLAGNPSEKREE
jgi:hypothetical protein